VVNGGGGGGGDIKGFSVEKRRYGFATLRKSHATPILNLKPHKNFPVTSLNFVSIVKFQVRNA
jgi:hypothetical protein